MDTIIQSIKAIRKSKKISQTKMGEYLSISQGTYRDIESEKIRLTLENYILICKYLEIDVCNLLKDKNKKTIELSEQEILLIESIYQKIKTLKK